MHGLMKFSEACLRARFCSGFPSTVSLPFSATNQTWLLTTIPGLAYGQMMGNLTSQAATMRLGGVPNDIVGNLGPLFIVLLIPFMDYVLYPFLRNAGIHFSPIKKMTTGFFLSSLAMASAAVTQYYIYKLSPCGSHINAAMAAGREDCEAPFTVWIQVVPYALMGLSEVLASITKLEYAYTKAPVNMRSTVQAFALLTNAISSALGQALTGLSEDPLLIWNYGSVAVLAFLGGCGFYLTFWQADRDEDKLNNIQRSAFLGKHEASESGNVKRVVSPQTDLEKIEKLNEKVVR